MPRPAVSLKAKALSLIAQREHSRIELRRKLLSHLDRQVRKAEAQATAVQGDRSTADPATAEAGSAAPCVERQVDELLDWLTAKDLLSAQRFVETRIAARAPRFGNLRIRQELAQHGFDVDVQTAAGLHASELQRARAVWTKRFDAPAADPAGRARQMRFLAARGFSAEVVRRVVKGGGEDDDAVA